LLLDFELKSVNSKQTSRFRALLPAVKICQDLLGQNRFLMVKALKPKELDFSYSVISVISDSVVNAFKVKGKLAAPELGTLRQ